MKNGDNGDISARTVERLVVYRRLLQKLAAQGVDSAYSHQLAELANNSAAQVRRDLMIIGYTGSPSKGYVVAELIAGINELFTTKGEQNVALVGAGNLGQAIIAHFGQRQPQLGIIAAFDVDPTLIGTELYGCPCHSAQELTKVVREQNIELGIITTPPTVAQKVADLMIMSGVKGILNFAPVPLKVPEHVFVDDVDIATKLEKVAFFCT